MRELHHGDLHRFGRSPDEFRNLLKDRLDKPLPGIDAQVRLAPQSRITSIRMGTPGSAQVSSVLILLYPSKDQLTIPFILRTEYDGPHSGQISLPGGKKEEADQDLVQTALREAKEETGIDIASIEILGNLTTLYIPPSNYVVLPVVAFAPFRPDFTPDPFEVQEIIEVNVKDLTDQNCIKSKNLNVRSGMVVNAPGFQLGNHFIWGATAMILSEFIEIVSELK